MTKRTVTIRIETKLTELAASLFEEDGTGELPFDFGPMEEEDEAELLVEGRLVTTTNEVKLLYEESELSGMEGSVTCLSFLRANPDVVTMTRSGEVRTALVFEE